MGPGGRGHDRQRAGNRQPGLVRRQPAGAGETAHEVIPAEVSSKMHPDLDIAPEIAAALAERRAVVALESTIIAHGMPYPDNLDVARQIETIIRREGAVPATIAILRGRLKVGLDAEELQHLAA